MKLLNYRMCLCLIFLSIIRINSFPSGHKNLNHHQCARQFCLVFDWIFIFYLSSFYFSQNCSHLTVVLVWIFLITNEDRHLFICLGLFVLLLLWNDHLHFCSFFYCVIFFYLVLYINLLFKICMAKSSHSMICLFNSLCLLMNARF